MKIKQMLSMLKLMTTPGLFKVMKDWKSVVRFHFIHAAMDSGLLQALETPKSYSDLAQLLNVSNEELLLALLDVGLSIGELSLKNNTYAIKGKVSNFVIREKGDSLGALIQANVTYYNSAYRNIADRMQGGELGDDLGQIGDLVARVSKIQEPFIKHFIADAVSGLHTAKMLEIGCGSGTFMKAAYEANNEVSGIGMDCDEDVVKQAESNIARWGLSDRFKVVLGDIKEYDIQGDGPYDYISLYNILYYFTPDEQVVLLEKLRANLSNAGRLAIVNTTQSNGKDAMAANLNLVNCSLKGVYAVPHLQHIQKILSETGFKQVKTTQLLPNSTVYCILAE